MKGGYKGGGKPAELFEKWKMFLGHISLGMQAEDVKAFLHFTLGYSPAHVHMKFTSNTDPNDIGLNSAFVEWQTPLRLSQIDGAASKGATRL